MLTSTARPTYQQPLPTWVRTLRQSQVDAVNEIIDAFDDGADVVFLDGPVGSGKTLIGELVRRELNARSTTYICSDKALQDQFVKDFPYAKVLKGRANYRTITGKGQITADDCTSRGPGDQCRYCPSKGQCPYTIAKNEAIDAPLAVLNTSMFLSMTNHVHAFTDNDLVIADECDTLEGALVGFVEYEVPQWVVEMLGLELPKKAVRKPTLISWLGDVLSSARVFIETRSEGMDAKQLRRWQGFRDETAHVRAYLQRDVDAANSHEDDDSDVDDSGRWIRDYDTKTLKLRPVTVQHYGLKNLWRYGRKWLCMSGTIISSDEMAESLGLPLDYRTVVVPSSFPVENRQIIVAPVANPVYKLGVGEWDKLAYAIREIADEHDGRMLVHCVSYKMAAHLHDAFRGRRPKFTHRNSFEKQRALSDYLRAENSILFSPSMARGVDLAGDKCRVMAICKVPYMSLADKQVSSRMRLPGGQTWYAIQAIRDIVQMTGRGVRSDDDHCLTFILDEAFPRQMLQRYEQLFPKYFRDALNTTTNIRWLMKGAA